LGAHALGIDLRAAVERYVDPRNGNFPLFVHRDLHHRGDVSHEAIVRSDAESLSGRTVTFTGTPSIAFESSAASTT
jgi:hypothetical protein